METYELMESGKSWLFRKEGSPSILKFPSRIEGLDFGIDFVGEVGGVLKIKNNEGKTVDERFFPGQFCYEEKSF